MRLLRRSAAATLLTLSLAFSQTALAAPSECPEHYLAGQRPEITQPRLAREARELCFREYAVIYSGISRTPLASAEHLTRSRIEQAHGLERENAFHEEERLLPAQRARLADYAGSGFDRGHMAPSGDMSTPETQAESFSLANIAPQDPGSNRCLWEGIESAVRDLALREGEVFVVTGPLFEGADLRQLRGRVLVPTGFYKAVYVPSRRIAAAYVAPNAPGMDWQAVSVAALRDRVGVAVFPGVPETVRARLPELPAPKPHNVRGSCARMTVAQGREPQSSSGAARPADAGSISSGFGDHAGLVVLGIVAVVLCWGLYRVLGR